MGLFSKLTKRTKEFQKATLQLAAASLIEQLRSQPRNQEIGRLLRFGFKCYSQGDEDGIINEIFQRIGVTNRYFVEFGTEEGLENNTLFLLLQGWKGLWMDGGPDHIRAIKKTFANQIQSGQLKVQEAFIGPENINELFAKNNVPTEIDFLSIDIDGNDYHVFEALKHTSARVVALEYNAKLRAPLDWVMKFNPKHIWDGTDYFGASLKALERLLDKRGYALVGCNITGVNAFFVRKDLLGNKFCSPYTAENHEEPARYFLISGLVSGHPSNPGEFRTSY